MKPILGYWDVRGRCNPIRMILHYAGVEFEDKRYRSHDQWFKTDKIQLKEKLDFPNLPYYMDDAVQITQTRAILHYLGRKHNLDGENEIEVARMSLIVEQVWDLVLDVAKIAYPPHQLENKEEIHQILKKAYVENLEKKLGVISVFLGTDEWMAGSRLTYVDFIIYDALDIQRRLFLPKHLNEFSNLVTYLSRMEGLPGVKEYMNSDAFRPLPIFGPTACFGNTEDYRPTE